MTKAILVTGGAGYIGSHVCKALALAGYLPVVYDNLSRGHREAVQWGPLVVGDLRCSEAIVAALGMHRIEAVMHFAALSEVGQSNNDPALYYDNNVGGTMSLLKAMRACHVDDLVFSSTCAVYGTPQTIPITEQARVSPVNPYGETKLAIERMLRWYETAYGMHTVSLRYFNAAGADPDGEIGENHQPESHLIPLVITAALGYSAPVQIFGTDYPTPDGTAIRDYIHVRDLAEAHVLALERIMAHGSCRELNLGTGSGHSVHDVIATVAMVTGCKVPHQPAPRRLGDPPILVADPRLAQNLLRWQPRFSDLLTIVRTAAQWHSRTTVRELSVASV